jgi:hypothetical protein
MKTMRLACFTVALVWLALPAIAEELRPLDRPEDVGFAGDRLKRVTAAFQGYVDSGQLPGAVVLIARNTKSPISAASAIGTARSRSRCNRIRSSASPRLPSRS